MESKIKEEVKQQIAEGVAFEYSVDNNGVKENIIINSKSNVYRYSFIIACENLMPNYIESEKRIIFSDPETFENIFEIPAPYMFDANGTACCVSCADVIDSNNNRKAPKQAYICPETGAKLTPAVVKSIITALHEEPDQRGRYTQDSINNQIQTAVSAQTEYAQFVNRMAAHYNTCKENRDFTKLYDRTWQETTIEKFNANIHNIFVSQITSSADKHLLTPTYSKADVDILFKQLIV